MIQLMLLDIPPDPRGLGGLLAVVLLVVGSIALLVMGLVVVLWYRKRSLRGVEMIRPDAAPAGRAPQAQPSNPNQP